MHQALPVRRAWIDRLPGGAAACAALTILVVSAATIAGAWYFQLVVGLAPCPLCLEQRIPHYIIVPLALVVAIAAWLRAPRAMVAAGFAALGLAALTGAALGAYHAGVEWHFWPGPADCTGPLSDLTAGGSLLDTLKSVHVVRCDEAAWRFLGISLAGYNVLISLLMAAIAGFGLLARRRPA
jgi:disulfide bond formation protein DsbB